MVIFALTGNTPNMYRNLFVAAFFAIFISFLSPSQAQKSYEKRHQKYSVNKDKSVPLSQKKIYNKAMKWLKNTNGVKLVRFNESEFKIEGEGLMKYENDVILENIFLSKDANLRTKGTISYKIIFTCEEGKYKVEFTDFTHEAFYNRYGKISIGELLMNENVPLKKCFENTKWCNAVWKDMKAKARRHVTEKWIDIQKTIQ